MSRPATEPAFSTSGANVVEPSSGKKVTGWLDSEIPPSEFFNWIHKITYDWIHYFAGIIPDGAVPLKSATDAADAALAVQKELMSILNPRTNTTGSSVWRDFGTDGAGAILMVGESAALKLSTDYGQTWTAGTPGNSFTNNYTSCAFGAGVFVATGIISGSHGVIQSSSNGVAFTERVNDASYSINQVVFNGSIFVALADNGAGSYKTYTSANGTAWTAHAIGSALLGPLSFGAGVFVATDGAHAPRTSTDGVTWTTRTFGSSSTLVPGALAYSAGQGHVAYGRDGTSHREVQTSPDGIAWTRARLDSATATSAVSLLVGDHCAVALGFANAILGSSVSDLDWVVASGVSSSATDTRAGNRRYDGGRILKVYPHLALAIGADASAAGAYSISHKFPC